MHHQEIRYMKFIEAFRAFTTCRLLHNVGIYSKACIGHSGFPSTYYYYHNYY